MGGTPHHIIEIRVMPGDCVAVLQTRGKIVVERLRFIPAAHLTTRNQEAA